MSHDLAVLLKRRLELRETYEQRAVKVLEATQDLSEEQRIVEILEHTVGQVTIAKPPHRPGLYLSFAKNHEWLGPMVTSRRGEVFLYGLSALSPFYYAWLIEEMEKRGGNIRAARSIVEQEYIEGRRNFWYHPLRTETMNRKEAAHKVLTLYRRNRVRELKRIEKRLSRQIGHKWLVVPTWARHLKVVANLLRAVSVANKEFSSPSSNRTTWRRGEDMTFAPIGVRRTPDRAKRS